MIEGVFVFIFLIFKGTQFPPPNPDLHMEFRFIESNENYLYYSRKGESGFCERKASYVYDGEFITQKTTWLNEKNAEWCSSDPDMQLGRETKSKFKVKDNFLYLNLDLSDDEITLVWEKKVVEP